LTAPTGFWQAMGRAGAANVPRRCRRDNARSRRSPPEGSEEKAPPRRERPGRREITGIRRKAEAAPKKTRRRAKPCLACPCPCPEPEALGPSPHLLDAPRGGKADDLTALKGVGAKLATSLNEFGIYHFDQLATLDEEGIDWLNEQQAGFKMLCARYDVVEQARARLA
jgi:NADH-quinone oxidoreductase subunit E